MPPLDVSADATLVAPDRPPLPGPATFLRHGALLLLTLLTTTVFGADLLTGRTGGEQLFAASTLFAALRDPHFWETGLLFSVPLIAILVAHELGHWFAARRHGLDASLPWFLPVPAGVGTFGAFIRIRSRFRTRRDLFDVGVAGPLAGVAVAAPLLVIGLAMSRPLRELPPWRIVPGESLATILGRGLFPSLSGLEQMDPHPFVFAAWFGLFLTALNLLPIGQLDGGHALYAVSPAAHRRVGLLTSVALVVIALRFEQPVWGVWGLLGFTPFRRHPAPAVPDVPLGRRRRAVAFLALALLIFCFVPIPITEIVVLPPRDSPALEAVTPRQHPTRRSSVTGPSFTDSTAMSAPKRPVATGMPGASARTRSTSRS